MRWWLACPVAWLLVVGCDSPAATLDGGTRHDSALGGGGGEENCGPVSQYPDCSLTCGNGHVETCSRINRLSTHCVIYIDMQELCDGPVSELCTSLGYYAGTATCGADCFSLADTTCDACAPGSLACTSIAFQRGVGLSVSGTEIAQRGANGDLQLFDANGAPIVLVAAGANSVTATSTGWLVSSPHGLQTLSYAGVLGSIQPALDPTATVVRGPGSHYLELWRQGAMMPIRAVLLDATGASVGSPFDTLMFDTGGELAVTSDGVQAFMGLDGKLAVVADDGTVTISSSTFPSFASGHTFLTSASSHWYVATEGADWSAQRFDGSGAPVGLAVHIPGSASGFIGGGDELFAVLETPNATTHATPIQLVRYTVDGTAAATVTVGAVRIPYTPAALASLGGDIVVSWSGPEGMNLARVAAP